MERDGIHSLTAAYALDALEENEQREYETHLDDCERCRDELDGLADAAAALAFAVDAPPPPADLRERIIERARGERATVIPFRHRRRAFPIGTLAAAAAACLALGLGIWAYSLSSELDRERDAARVLADPVARSIELEGARGRVVVDGEGRAVLVSRVEAAPAGQTYKAWVIAGGRPAGAGAFDGDDERDRHLLTIRVPRGAIVAVTIEDDPDVDAPTRRPLFSART